MCKFYINTHCKLIPCQAWRKSRRSNDYPEREYTISEILTWKCHASYQDEDIVYSIWKHIAKCTKNRDFGETGYILCDYDPANRRIYQKNLGDKIAYSWDHTGLKEPEDQAIRLEEFQIRPGESERAPF